METTIDWKPIINNDVAGLEIGMEYLISSVYDFVAVATFFKLDGRYAFEEIQFNEVFELDEVTAWAELPNPYRKE